MINFDHCNALYITQWSFWPYFAPKLNQADRVNKYRLSSNKNQKIVAFGIYFLCKCFSEIEVFFVDFFVLDMWTEPTFRFKVSQEGKSCSRLLEQSCERNWDRPNDTSKIMKGKVAEPLKVPLWQKINYDFSLDIKTMLTKHQVTQVLSLHLKNSPIFTFLRELDRGEHDVKGSLV